MFLHKKDYFNTKAAIERELAKSAADDHVAKVRENAARLYDKLARMREI